MTVLIGCSGKPAGFPEVYPCSIIVRNGTEPVAGATIRLYYTGRGDLTVFGTTNQEGIAAVKTLMASCQSAGAPAGDARITISKPSAADTKTNEEIRSMPAEQQEAYKQEIVQRVAALPRIFPAALEMPEKTPLLMSVKAERTGNTMQVNVKDFLK